MIMCCCDGKMIPAAPGWFLLIEDLDDRICYAEPVAGWIDGQAVTVEWGNKISEYPKTSDEMLAMVFCFDREELQEYLKKFRNKDFLRDTIPCLDIPEDQD